MPRLYLCIVLLVGVISVTHAATLTVEPNGEDGAYLSIQEAIQNAADGDIIQVMPGRYEETLFVDKQITIQGSGVGLTTLSAIRGDAIVLTNNKPLSIRNMLIRAGGNGISAPVDRETRLRNSVEEDKRFVVVRNCVITDCGGAGIFYETPGSIVVSNSIIKNNGLSGIMIDAMSPEDIHLSGGSNITIPIRFPTDLSVSNCLISANGNSGISIERSNDGGATVANTIIMNHRHYAVNNTIIREFKNSSNGQTTVFPNDDTAEFENVRLNYSCVWNNQMGIAPEGEIDENPVGVTSVSEEDPLLADDLTLSAESGCRDAGDPSPSSNDPDGTRNDVGAFGGQNAATWLPRASDTTIPLALGSGNRIVVDALGESSQFTSINDAIQAADDGDIIEVLPGQYQETLIIDRQVFIEGAGPGVTTLIATMGDAIVLTNDKPLSIRNMLIRAGGNGIATYTDRDTRLRNSEQTDKRFVTIKNCVITDCGGSGIYFEMPGAIMVINSIIKNSGQSAVLIDAMSPEDIHLSGGSNITYPIRYQTDLSIVNSLISTNANSAISTERTNGGGVSVVNSIIADNGGYAVNNTIIREFKNSGNGQTTLFPPTDTAEFESASVVHSVLWNNENGNQPTGENELNNIDTAGNLSVDPMLAVERTLLPDSPAIDAGDTAPSANDPDGSRNNIGAFGGPGAVDWGTRHAQPELPIALNSGTTRVVDPAGTDGAYTTIGAAIAAAQDGDLIQVKPGFYEETLTIDKGLTIEGSGAGTTTLASLFGDAIIINSNKPLLLKNMLIRSGGIGVVAYISEEMRLRDSTHEDKRFLTLKNCIITDCGSAGIYFETPGAISVINSIIKNSGQSGVLIDAISQEDIHLSGGSNITIPLRFPTDLSVVNSQISNNGRSGIKTERTNNGGVSVVNSIISNNAEFAIDNRIIREPKNSTSGTTPFPTSDTAEFESARIYFSCLWNNEDGISPVGEVEDNNVIGFGVIQVDPMIDVDSTLLEGSPCIDAGDPAPSSNDPDTTRSDIGAFGGTSAAEWAEFIPPVIPTATPTMTPTPIFTEPTPTPIPPVSEPDLIFEFDQATLADNGWSEIPGGFMGSPAGTTTFVDNMSDHIASSVDNMGMAVTVRPRQITNNQGENVTIGETSFLHTIAPIQTDGPVLIRVIMRASDANASIALGTLKGNLIMGQVDGSIGLNNPVTSRAFVDDEGALVLVYEPDEGTNITPLIQFNSTKNLGETVIHVDRMEFYFLDETFVFKPEVFSR